MTTASRNEALRLLTLGYHVIPLQYKSKRPGYKDWQHLLISPDRANEHFPDGKQFNIGILLGTEVADGVFLQAVDVDTDDDQILLRVRHALPPCPQKRGLKGFTAFVGFRSSQLKKVIRLSPGPGQIEFLGKGQQTVIPPSLHPDTHDEYVWLTAPLGPPQSLPFIDASHLDELDMIATRPDSKVFQLNELQWLGPNKGGNVDDTILHASAFLVERGWTDDQIIARINLAARRMLRDNPVRSQWDEDMFEKRVHNVIESARKKGYDSPKKTRKQSKADLRVSATLSFAELQGGMDAYWNDKATLRHYSDGVWHPVPNDLLTHRLYHHIIPMGGFDATDIVACSQLLKAGSRHYERKLGHMVALENGVVDLRDGKLLPFDPDHHLIAKLPFRYDPDADCPRYDAFVRDLLNREPDNESGIAELDEASLGQAVNALNEFVGLCLVPDNSFRKALVLIGPTSSGKSTIQKLMADFFDPTAVSSVSMSKIQDERYASSLKDTLINLTSEMGHDTYVDEETFKNMVSGDPMDFRRLYEQPIPASCTARFFIACNAMFKTRDPSGAIETRLVILRTRGPVPENKRDINLLDDMRTERPGIFNRLMLAYRALKKRKAFDPPPYLAQELDAFTNENRPVIQWLHEQTHQGQKQLDPNYTIPNLKSPGTPSVELYYDYLEWAKRNGMKPMSSITWGKECKLLGFESSLKRVGGVVTRMREIHLIQNKNF